MNEEWQAAEADGSIFFRCSPAASTSEKKGRMEAVGTWAVDNREIVRPALAVYFLLAGIYGVRSLFTGGRKHYEEFAGQDTAFKVGVYFREYLFRVLDIVVGMLILFHVSWGKVLGIALLVASSPYSAREFAWGYSKGKPSGKIFLISLAGFCLWNGFLIFLMVKVL